jgi:hypothetical protein
MIFNINGGVAMQQTIFAILTNKEIRNPRIVELELDKEFTAGVPWLDSSQVELPNTKIDVGL